MDVPVLTEAKLMAALANPIGWLHCGHGNRFRVAAEAVGRVAAKQAPQKVWPQSV